jgi:hypothetical protein
MGHLNWYLSDALGGGPGDDGLFQRFQIIVWPDPPLKWTLVDRAPNGAALANWFGVPTADFAAIFPNLANFSTQTLTFLG